jgi:ABC-type transport system involved in multi-copper enzyme maturation permease subunit
MLIVTIDASSIATAEFEKGTAESLFLAPVTLADFILGKLLASLTLWLLVFAVATPYIIVASSGTHLAGFFLGYVALFGTLGMVGLLCVTLALSLLYRSGRNTLTTALAILLFLAIPALFGSTLKNSSMVAGFGRINPIDNIFSALDNVLVDYQIRFSANLRFLAPVVGFVIVGILFLFLAARVFKRQGIAREAG